MAMTKKERAEFDAAIKALRIKSALRWTDEVAPDLPPPKAFGEKHSQGWIANAYDGSVKEAWSDSGCHGYGIKPDDAKYRSASQGPRSLHSTKILALKAGRSEMEKQFARKLADIDAKIEEASNV
jgi:hypothetical protein